MKKLPTLFLSLLLSASAALAANTASPVTPDEALQELKAGNARYVSGKSAHPRIEAQRRVATAIYGQTPHASILGCADSRVPPEIVFDQPFANLFVVRVAGNVCGVPELASVEYSVLVLKVPLIVVLGHTKCGAVQATIDNKDLPGSLPQLVSMIKPSVEAAQNEKNAAGELLDNAIKQNVYHSITELNKSPIIKEAVDSHKLKIVGAVRDIKDGHIVFLPEQKLAAAAK